MFMKNRLGMQGLVLCLALAAGYSGFAQESPPSAPSKKQLRQEQAAKLFARLPGCSRTVISR